MPPSHARLLLAAAGILLALAVTIGALGAHALRGVLDARQLASLETAVDYQFFNALGLLGVGLMARDAASKLLSLAGWLLVPGILAFSGGIYLMLAGAPRALGLVTPAGGVLLIAAWVVFTIAVLADRGGGSRP